MSKPETKTETAKPTQSARPEVLTPTPNKEAPLETRNKRLPRQLTDAEHREVLAKVRSVLPSEADALESDREYASARPVVAKEDKVAADARVKALEAKVDAFKARARELPGRVSYWFDLYTQERKFANPGERQVPSPEWIGQKVVDFLNLDDTPTTKQGGLSPD